MGNSEFIENLWKELLEGANEEETETVLKAKTIYDKLQTTGNKEEETMGKKIIKPIMTVSNADNSIIKTIKLSIGNLESPIVNDNEIIDRINKEAQDE